MIKGTLNILTLIIATAIITLIITLGICKSSEAKRYSNSHFKLMCQMIEPDEVDVEEHVSSTNGEEKEIFSSSSLKIIVENNILKFFEFGAFRKYKLENAEDVIVVRNFDEIYLCCGGKLLCYSISGKTLMEVANNARYALLAEDGKLVVEDYNGYMYKVVKTGNTEDPFTFNCNLMFEDGVVIKYTP